MKLPRFNLWRWLWSRVWLLSERSGIGLGRFAPWVFHQVMGCDTKFTKVEAETGNKLTEAQLHFRLQEFLGAEQDAIKFEDYEYAQECSDVVSIIRELQACRKVAGKPVLSVLFKNGWPVEGTAGIMSASPSFPDGYHDFYATPQPEPVVHDDGRADFEAWFRFHYGEQHETVHLLRANGGMNYLDPHVDLAWIAWKDSRSVMLAPSSQEVTP